eukprot:CAMPEP_0170565168 /NCGR_PEP_ID=MMETSP0211-20121228/77191_1 /TAXON_ID=311385 /ORGANISM="Pseudokeronopsis sp., Strain OXSARD2" /LENGTH=91 /DNA_ID=CAMNT_0010885607 /DNA_START=249 /DNA_END=524 /DNA_ORIENTATION=+
MDEEGGTGHILNVVNVPKALRDQEPCQAPSHAADHTPDAQISRHQQQSARIHIGSKLRGWACPQGPPKQDDVVRRNPDLLCQVVPNCQGVF